MRPESDISGDAAGHGADGQAAHQPSGRELRARRTLTIISGWTLADSRNLQLDIVRHAAVSGLPSAIFCPRLSGCEIAVRIMSAETDVPMKVLLADGGLDEDER